MSVEEPESVAQFAFIAAQMKARVEILEETGKIPRALKINEPTFSVLYSSDRSPVFIANHTSMLSISGLSESGFSSMNLLYSEYFSVVMSVY